MMKTTKEGESQVPGYKLSELAHVQGSGGARALTDLAKTAAPGSSDELMVNAWMVHQHILAAAQRENAPELPDVEDGATWLKWQGTLKGAIKSLQIGGPSADSDTVTKARNSISQWLRLYGNAICISWTTSGTGNARYEVTWAIRTAFREAPPAPGSVHLRQHMTGQALLSAPDRDDGDGRVITPAPPASQDLIPCQWCSRPFKDAYYARHVFDNHLDATELLSKVIKQRGEVQSTTLTEVLRQAIGARAITTGYVARLLSPLTDASPPQVKAHHGFGGDYKYIWVGAAGNESSSSEVNIRQEPSTAPFTPQPQSPSPASQFSHVNGTSRNVVLVPAPGSSVSPAPSPPPPAPPEKLTAPAQPAPAKLAPPVLSPAAPASPAASVGLNRAIQDGMDGIIKAAVAAMDGILTAAEAAAAEASQSSALEGENERLRARNEELLAYQRKVKSLLGDV